MPVKRTSGTITRPPVAKKLNPDFVKLQIKAESFLDKTLDYMIERTKEVSLNKQTAETLEGLRACLETLCSVGLLKPDRPEINEETLPEPNEENG